MRVNLLVFAIIATTHIHSSAQGNLTVSMYDGIATGGYVNNGSFLNFTGPAFNYTYGNMKLLAGMLPSLRFRQDRSSPANSFVTPNLGMGITVCYQYIAVQFPFYYNAKTASEKGSWHAGIGIGLRFNELNKKQQ